MVGAPEVCLAHGRASRRCCQNRNVRTPWSGHTGASARACWTTITYYLPYCFLSRSFTPKSHFFHCIYSSTPRYWFTARARAHIHTHTYQYNCHTTNTDSSPRDFVVFRVCVCVLARVYRSFRTNERMSVAASSHCVTSAVSIVRSTR